MDITHDVGGAIGFYTYEEESEKLIQFSQWLDKNPQADSLVVNKKRATILHLLNQSLDEVKKGSVSSGE